MTSKVHPTRGLGAFCTLLLICSTLLTQPLPAQAQDTPTLPAKVIYSGEAVGSSVAIAPWGGGQVSDAQGTAFTTAGHSIKISTAGMYQGGEIVFLTPVPLGDLKADKTRYLQIIYSVAPSTKYSAYTDPYVVEEPTTPSGSTGASGVMGGGPRGGMGGGGGSPAFHYSFEGSSFQIAQAPHASAPGSKGRGGPMGGFGIMPGMGAPQTPAPAPAEITGVPNVPIGSLHVIMQFSNGSKVEVVRPASVSAGEDVKWLRTGIPLSTLPLSDSAASGAQLTRVYLSSDVPATINVGEMRLLSDRAPLFADAGPAKTVNAGDNVLFVGSGGGGASALSYEWNFDTPSNFVPQATGAVAHHVFANAGDFTATLRVSDVDGVKSPAIATVTVHVNQQASPPMGMGGPPEGMGGYPPGMGGPPPGMIMPGG